MQVNHEEVALLGAMNRIRAGYLPVASDAEPFLGTSGHDDVTGVWESLTLGVAQPLAGNPMLQLLVTTPATVAVLDAVMGGLIAGAIVLFLGWGAVLATIVAVAAGIALFLLLMAWMARGWARFMEATAPRFPSSDAD